MMLPRDGYIQVVKRAYPPFYCSVMFEGYNWPESFKKFLGFDFCVADMVAVDDIFFNARYHVVDLARLIEDKLFKSRDFFNLIKEESLKRENQFILASEGDDFERFCQAYAYYMPTLAIYYICDEAIENRVKRLLLAATKDQNKTEKLMGLLTIPLEDSFQVKAKCYLATFKDISGFVKQFDWIKSRYGKITPHTEEEAGKYLAELEGSDFLSHYKQEKEAITETISEAKDLLGQNGYLIDVMQFFIYYRTQRTNVMSLASCNFAKQLEKYAAKLGISYEDLLYCTHVELAGKLPPRETIEERKTHFAFVGEPDKYDVHVGDEYRRVKSVLCQNSEKGGLITGRIAFSGNATGKVCLLSDASESGKVQDGDVLVASMTTPNMVPAMKKACAFVTDEGGITCHAAILARELKKPCIIGTKNATKVLKDGDLVEVDAEKGIVKIVKSS